MGAPRVSHLADTLWPAVSPPYRPVEGPPFSQGANPCGSPYRTNTERYLRMRSHLKAKHHRSTPSRWTRDDQMRAAIQALQQTVGPFERTHALSVSTLKLFQVNGRLCRGLLKYSPIHVTRRWREYVERRWALAKMQKTQTSIDSANFRYRER